jgi:hypothetical protein
MRMTTLIGIGIAKRDQNVLIGLMPVLPLIMLSLNKKGKNGIGIILEVNHKKLPLQSRLNRTLLMPSFRQAWGQSLNPRLNPQAGLLS